MRRAEQTQIKFPNRDGGSSCPTPSVSYGGALRSVCKVPYAPLRRGNARERACKIEHHPNLHYANIPRRVQNWLHFRFNGTHTIGENVVLAPEDARNAHYTRRKECTLETIRREGTSTLLGQSVRRQGNFQNDTGRGVHCRSVFETHAILGTIYVLGSVKNS